MFSRPGKRRETADPGPLTAPKASGAGLLGVPSIVSTDMTIVGDLRSGGDVHVDGSVQGDINVRHLTVGEGAAVRGEVSADSVRICGSVTGCIRAREVVLTATARMHGDVHHEILSIEAGALLDGHCRPLVETASAAAKEPIATKQLDGGRLTLEPPPSTH